MASQVESLRSLWQVYLDNFDVLEIVRLEDLDLDATSDEMMLAKRIYHEMKVPMNDKKEENRALNTASLGVAIKGTEG
eukprot:8776027-Karenia_brevis.AAC.1